MYTPRLKNTYKDEVAPALMKEFGYKSVMQAPCIQKICINQGLGKGVSDKKLIDVAVEELSAITGQKAIPCYSKKDISNFKLRKGMPIGVKVTLRGDNMYDFFDRLMSIALPRTRDFRGVKASGFDGRGNFTMGIKEQIVFPEIDIEQVREINGMDITIVTNAKTDEEAKALLDQFKFPFVKKN